MLSNATLTEEIFYFIYIFHFFFWVWASWDLTSQGALASAARGADGSGKLQLPLASSYTSDQPWQQNDRTATRLTGCGSGWRGCRENFLTASFFLSRQSAISYSSAERKHSICFGKVVTAVEINFLSLWTFTLAGELYQEQQISRGRIVKKKRKKEK